MIVLQGPAPNLDHGLSEAPKLFPQTKYVVNNHKTPKRKNTPTHAQDSKKKRGKKYNEKGCSEYVEGTRAGGEKRGWKEPALGERFRAMEQFEP